MKPFPIEIFRCPISGGHLREASADELAAFNHRHAGEPARTLGDGTVVAFPWESGWRTVSEPATWYPLVQGMPALIPDAACQD